MKRRALLLAPGLAWAQDGFPPSAEGLRLQGVAARRYLGFRVYEAALYLARPVRDADPALVWVRYLRRVALDDVRRAWATSLGETGWEDFAAWLRPIAPGDEERYAFRDGAAVLEGPGRPPLRLPPGGISTMLRASWLGATAPAALIRGWFPAS
jgi:hypothetical protein